MNKLKPISQKGIQKALEKAERYRLLNNPIEAESICLDILELDSENQEAIMMLVLALTDQFGKGVTNKSPNELLPRIINEYNREYHKGIILEREAKSTLSRNLPSSHHDAYEWLEEAMEAYEKAELLNDDTENDDALLRFNACVRTIEKYKLGARPFQGRELPLE